MTKSTRKYFLKLLPVKGHRARLDATTMELLRRVGADSVLISETGSGLVHLTSPLKTTRRAKVGARFDAYIQRAGALKVYGIANGHVFLVNDADAEAKIQSVPREPVANFEFIKIPLDLSEGVSEEVQEAPIDVEAFRASVKLGHRGSDIVEGGRRLSASELREKGWGSSAQD